MLATPDVARTSAELEARLGVRPGPGGQHLGLGTHNALLSLGPSSYLEVVGPDPAQPEPAGPRPLGVDGLTEPRLVAWAVAVPDLEDAVGAALERGHDLGPAYAMQRRRPDGVVLAWRLTPPPSQLDVVPFLIDWGDSPHPAIDAPGGVALVALRARHPDPASVANLLAALDVDLHVEYGDAPALLATLSGPAGTVELA